jgi:hypothetical protein
LERSRELLDGARDPLQFIKLMGEVAAEPVAGRPGARAEKRSPAAKAKRAAPTRRPVGSRHR